MKNNAELNLKAYEILKTKLLAVTDSEEFSCFHYASKQNDKLKENKVEFKAALFCPYETLDKDVNMWVYSGLEQFDGKTKEQINSLRPVQVQAPVDLMRTKWQSTFEMKKYDVSSFCIKLVMRDNSLSRPYCLKNVLYSLIRCLSAQYYAKDIHTDEDRQRENLMQRRFLTYLSGVDAMEIFRTTKSTPAIYSDEGAECVNVDEGYPIVAQNKDGKIRRDVKTEEYYESFKVVFLRFKDKEVRNNVNRRVEMIARNYLGQKNDKDKG